jgi:hypothetical protein
MQLQTPHAIPVLQTNGLQAGKISDPKKAEKDRERQAQT